MGSIAFGPTFENLSMNCFRGNPAGGGRGAEGNIRNISMRNDKTSQKGTSALLLLIDDKLLSEMCGSMCFHQSLLATVLLKQQ